MTKPETRDSPALEGAAKESGWVIERHINSELRYFGGRFVDDRGFSSKNEDAIRFAHQEDAAIVLSWLLGGVGRVAEHVWRNRSPAPELAMVNGRFPYIAEIAGQFFIRSKVYAEEWAYVCLSSDGKWQLSYGQEKAWPTREAAAAFLAQHADQPAAVSPAAIFRRPENCGASDQDLNCIGCGQKLGPLIARGACGAEESQKPVATAATADRTTASSVTGHHDDWPRDDTATPAGLEEELALLVIDLRHQLNAALADKQEVEKERENAEGLFAAAQKMYRSERRLIWTNLQRLAPWAGSNDLDWIDEIMCGLAGVEQRIEAAASELAALKAAKGQ